MAAVLAGLLGAPMAVAQAIMVIPAPPAPPPPPEAPAAAEIDTTDGSVRATFAGKITAVNGGAQSGFNVRLEGKSEGSPCTADMNGLVSINVAKGDAVNEGGLIGKRQNGCNLRVSVTCADGLGGDQHSLAVPPAPPAPVAPAVKMAQLAVPKPAPVPSPMAAPSPPSAPSPLPAPASLAAPAPPAPPAQMAPQATPLTPATLPTPPTPVTPPTGPSPIAPVSPVSPEAPPAS